MKKILIAAYADASSNPRPNRMIHFVREQYDVHYLGTGCIEDSKITFIPLSSKTDTVLYKISRILQLKVRRFNEVSLFPNEKNIIEVLKRNHYDVIVCHDLFLLPLLFEIDNGEKIIFDAREYYPRQFENRVLWRFFYQKFNKYLCETYLNRIKFCVTVSKGLAKEYFREYGVRMDVMLSLPREEKYRPSEVDPHKIRMIYHGGINPSRQIEKMIDVMGYLDERFSLDLMVVATNNKYFKKIKMQIRQYPKVNIVPPVPFCNLIDATNLYDIGFYFWLPAWFNVRHMMPNKLFEFIQARLAVAIGPSPDMKEFVESQGVGVVAEEFTPHAMANALNKLSAHDIRSFKQRSDIVARQFNASMNKRKILKLIEEIL